MNAPHPLGAKVEVRDEPKRLRQETVRRPLPLRNRTQIQRDRCPYIIRKKKTSASPPPSLLPPPAPSHSKPRNAPLTLDSINRRKRRIPHPPRPDNIDTQRIPTPPGDRRHGTTPQREQGVVPPREAVHELARDAVARDGDEGVVEGEVEGTGEGGRVGGGGGGAGY